MHIWTVAQCNTIHDANQGAATSCLAIKTFSGLQHWDGLHFKLSLVTLCLPAASVTLQLNRNHLG